MAIELQWLDWLRNNAEAHAAVGLGIGDDMAVLQIPPQPSIAASGAILVSSDMLLDSVHFNTGEHSFGEIGRKSLACSLSDCAAMAVRPLAATVSLAVPHDVGIEQLQELFRGMQTIASEFATAIAGGDTTSWAHPLAIDVAIVAVPVGDHPPIRRSGARPGDQLLATGALGGSLLGRHMTFVPRVREAIMLQGLFGDALHAMMDVSDGVSLDLSRMIAASAAGANLSECALLDVASPDAHRMAAADGRSVLDHVLSDGEDFELLIAADAAVSPQDLADAARRIGTTIREIGRVTESGFSLTRSDGKTVPLVPSGYCH